MHTYSGEEVIKRGCSDVYEDGCKPYMADGIACYCSEDECNGEPMDPSSVRPPAVTVQDERKFPGPASVSSTPKKSHVSPSPDMRRPKSPGARNETGAAKSAGTVTVLDMLIFFISLIAAELL